MTRFTPFLLLLAIVTAGCTTTSVHYVDETEFAARVGEMGVVKFGNLVMWTGERFKAQEIELQDDSLRFVANRSWSGAPSEQQTATLEAIRSFTVINYGKGAVEGATRGTLAGLALIGVAALAGDEEGWAMLGALVTAPIVAASGFFHGLMQGKRNRYEWVSITRPHPER